MNIIFGLSNVYFSSNDVFEEIQKYIYISLHLFRVK